MSREPLYCCVLGENFQRLHPVLRRFHEAPDGGRGVGVFRVRRAPGRWRNLVANVMGLPAEAEVVQIQLTVVPHGRTELWLRTFDGRPFRTQQWHSGGLLIEKAGPVAIGLELAAVEGGMTFRTRRVWFCGVPLPLSCAPVVEADVVPDDTGWTVEVTVRVPLFGLLTSYGGRLTPS